MPILDFNNRNEVKEYEEFLKNNKYARFPQSLEWRNVKKNWSSEIVYIKKEGKIKAGILILIKKVLGNSLFYAQEGPACDPNDIDIIKELMNEVDIVAKKHNAFVLCFEPNIKATKELRDKYIKEGFKVTPLEDNFNPSSVMQPLYTFILNLKNKTEDELLKSFASKTRYNIRLAKRKGVEAEYGNGEDLIKRFYKLHKITCERSKIAIREYEYYENLVKSFGKNARVYIGKHENDDLFGAICISYGVETYYVYGGSSNIKRNYMASEYIMFEMIKWGLENKCEEFNFGGFVFLNEKNGLYQFKIKFTGKDGLLRKIGLVEKVYNPFMYFIYHNLLPIRNKIKNLLNGSGLQ